MSGQREAMTAHQDAAATPDAPLYDLLQPAMVRPFVLLPGPETKNSPPTRKHGLNGFGAVYRAFDMTDVRVNLFSAFFSLVFFATGECCPVQSCSRGTHMHTSRFFLVSTISFNLNICTCLISPKCSPIARCDACLILFLFLLVFPLVTTTRTRNRQDLIRDGYVAVGILEQWNTTLQLFHHALDMPVMNWEEQFAEGGKHHVDIVNKQLEIETLQQAWTDSELKKYMRLDLLLYEHAVDVFHQQARSHGLL